jgi:hypothetical protein
MDKQRHEDCRHGRGSKFQDAVLLGCRRTRGQAAEDEHEEKPDGRRNEEGIPADYQHGVDHMVANTPDTTRPKRYIERMRVRPGS